MSFRVGQFAACITSGPWHYLTGEPSLTAPTKGHVYTVTEVFLFDGYDYLRLAEIDAMRFNSVGFRPLDDANLAVFRKAAAPVPVAPRRRIPIVTSG